MFDRRTILKGGLVLAASPAGLRHAAAQAPAVVPVAALQEMIEAEASAARARHGAALAVVLGVVGPRGGGRLLFAGREGLTNPGGRRLILDGATPFEIGSIAKVFTACLHYQKHGPFTGRLGEWLAPRRLSRGLAAIPLADLARYQPGLAQDNHGAVLPPGAMASFDSLFGYLAGAQPIAPPGSCYSYSNLGWSLLAMAGAGAGSGNAAAFAERYDSALRAYGKGLGMSATGVFRPEVKARLPQAYRRDWRALPPGADYRPTYPAGVGSGGIVSTGADMLAFLRHSMGLGEGGMSSPALAYLQGPAFASPRCGGGRAPRTAYGWILHDVATPAGPLALVTKDGAVAGFTAWMGFPAWQGTGAPAPAGVFALCNGPGAAGVGLKAMRRILAA
ncbi:serine hydrolase domain-containing protein [Xanthobacter sp. KR7-65]|uniref:serine hydrolase domain-containing protein n=1 Tax=Xanthobacter sp. KR7-65 TaxID=3156612 RepID=UPI0032B5990C